MKHPALLPVLFAAATAAADPPDLTSAMEPLCNPNASRWTASQPYARAATSIGVCDGRLFVSGGDWDDNLGPCPIFAVDPYSGAYITEYESGAEAIDYFRYGSDGSLYAPSVDPREGHVNECSVARRKPDGTWTKLYAPNRWIRYSSSENAAYGTHNWDFAIWRGKIFTAGYGLGVGTELTTTRLADATPQINDANRTYASQYGGTFQQSRRFYAFLPFEDDLFCYPLNYAVFQANNFRVWDFEEWRFDESTSRFVCQTNSAANVVPGLSRSDMPFLGSNVYSDRIQLWHPTAFKGRVLYIAGIPEMSTYPFVLYSATNQNHSVRATRVDLGSGVVPFDVFVRGDVVSVLAAQYDSSAQKAVNSVWESTDGVSFTKKFTFSGVQYANALAYCDGAYYVAMGARQIVQNAWTFTGTDEVGKIYRIRDPAFADAIQVVAENAALSVDEGGTGVARFKLAAQPAAAVTASVRATGGVPAISTTVASVTFTPQDWNGWHEVALSVAEDDNEKVSSGSIVCGAGDPASLVPVSVKVTPVNNDVRVPDVPPDGLVDITVPNGDFTASSTVSIHTNKPFNDDPSGTNTANRFLVQSKSATITYDFGLPATVTGYGIHNFVPSGYAPVERAPHTWKFQASNDGATWTTLDERKLESGWTAGEFRYYAVSNATAYTQYRLAITDNNGNEYTQFARMEMYGTGRSLVPLTRTSTGALYTNSTSHASYGAAGAFDNNRKDSAGRWLATKADHMYVVWKFNEATAANVLRVWNGSNSGGGANSTARAPKAWTLYGSNDGTTWTALDARSDETGWSATGEDRFYDFDNDTAYLYYKYDCTALNGATDYLQLWELEFYYIEPDAVPGDPPDLTDALEYLGNPAYSRWPNSPMSRHVQDLFPYKGKIYTSGGEWDSNTGPCPIWAVDPYSGAFTNEFDAGTDAIYEFKEFTDGRLYTSAIDLHEGAANVGSTFRRESNGVWRAYYTACGACNIPYSQFGNQQFYNQGYKIHNWDMAQYKDYVFVCGYGISGSTNWCTKAMFDASPQLTTLYRYYNDPNSQNNPVDVDLRRFCTFLPFDDDIYCYPMQIASANNIGRFDWEEWRFDESARTFVCQTNTWANLAPGITLEAASFTFPTNSRAEIQLWHPTKFGSRALYIVGGHGDYGFNITPWAAYSAVNENHRVKATKVDLGGDGVKPFDVCVADGVAYLVAGEAGMKATMVTNSVWKSTDGVTFSKLFTFVATRQASAICYYDGYFYLGMGSNSFTKNGWPKVKGTDVSGRIYRVRLPQGDAVAVAADTAAAKVCEGETGTVSFCLASAPATNMALRVWSTDPRFVPSVASLSFSPADWNVLKPVAFAVAEDDESDANFKGGIVCGTGGPDCLSASVIVTATNNDFRVIETPPAGLVDLTRPDGAFTTTVPEGVTLTYNRPFNDCEVNTNKEERLVAKATSISVTYDFGTPTNVNAYGILNFGNSGFSPVERAPKSWTFEGSDDGVAWTQLDVRRFEYDWAIGEYRYYSFTNDACYSKYRISFTGNNGNEYTQVGRLEFYHVGDDSGGGGGEDEGEILVYEGFHSEDYVTTSATALKATNPVGHNVGFSVSDAWSSGTAVPKTVAGSLTLAAAHDMTETNGTGRLVMQNDGNQAAGRGIQRKFSATLPTSGTIYFRFLMKLSANTNTYFSILQSGGHWAGGLVKNAFNGGQDAMKSLTTDGIWMGYKKTGDAEISLFARIGGTDYLLPYNTSNTSPLLSTWSTYMFIAKIEIGAGAGGTDRVSIAAQPVATGAYSPSWDWSVKGVEANIVSGGAPVRYIAFAGQYQTSNKEVAIDQFTIATSLSKVCLHDPWPAGLPSELVIGAGDGSAGDAPLGFVENAAGEECFRVVLAEAVPGPYYTPFAAASLAERPVAAADSTTVAAAGPLPFAIPTEGRPTLFVSIVASTAPFEAGDALPNP